MTLYGAAKNPGDVDAITEDGSAPGGTNDGDMPAAPSVDLSAWDGATDPTAAEATDIEAAIDDLAAMVRELAAKQNELLAALKR